LPYVDIKTKLKYVLVKDSLRYAIKLMWYWDVVQISIALINVIVIRNISRYLRVDIAIKI